MKKLGSLLALAASVFPMAVPVRVANNHATAVVRQAQRVTMASNFIPSLMACGPWQRTEFYNSVPRFRGHRRGRPRGRASYRSHRR